MDESDLVRRLVATADKIGLGIQVTLQVGGLMVEGELCSVAEYYDSLAKQFAAAKSASAAADAARLGLVEGTQELVANANTVVAMETYVPEFVHLKKVTVTGATVFTAPYWRGRIDRIDGLIVGTRG